MDTPIGHMIGNSLEVAESISCLHGNGPDDLRDLVVKLGKYDYKCTSKNENLKLAKLSLSNHLFTCPYKSKVLVYYSVTPIERASHF